jgi:hypothetical protein
MWILLVYRRRYRWSKGTGKWQLEGTVRDQTGAYVLETSGNLGCNLVRIVEVALATTSIWQESLAVAPQIA